LDAILFSSVFFWATGALRPAVGLTAEAFAMEGFGVAGLEWDALDSDALEIEALEMADRADDLAAGLDAPDRAAPERAAVGFCLVAV
jgi:hypothetical protein